MPAWPTTTSRNGVGGGIRRILTRVKLKGEKKGWGREKKMTKEEKLIKGEERGQILSRDIYSSSSS